MFAIPFLMPQTEEEKILKQLSTSKLITVDSVESLHNTSEFSRSKETLSHVHLSPMSAITRRDIVKRPSIASAHHLNMDIEKRINMRDIGSLSSFGSIILSQSPKKSSLVPTNVPTGGVGRQHACTFNEGMSML